MGCGARSPQPHNASPAQPGSWMHASTPRSRSSRRGRSSDAYCATASTSACRGFFSQRAVTLWPEGLKSRPAEPIFAPDAEPSRKERGHRGVRPRHPNRDVARRHGAGSSSGPGPRRFAFVAVCRDEAWTLGTPIGRAECPRSSAEGRLHARFMLGRWTQMSMRHSRARSRLRSFKIRCQPSRASRSSRVFRPRCLFGMPSCGGLGKGPSH